MQESDVQLYWNLSEQLHASGQLTPTPQTLTHTYCAAATKRYNATSIETCQAAAQQRPAHTYTLNPNTHVLYCRIRKVLRNFHWNLSKQLHDSGQLTSPGPYLMGGSTSNPGSQTSGIGGRGPPLRLLVLSPGVDLSRTASHEEMKLVVMGLMQVRAVCCVLVPGMCFGAVLRST